MALSGKYDFKGIAKLNALGLKSLFASTPYLAWVLRGGKLSDMAFEFVGNWAANWGLVVLNLGAIYVNGEVDQHRLDKALSDGLSEIEQKGRDKISEKRGAEIDEAVRQAARDFIRFGAADGVPDDANSGFQGGSDPSF